MRRRLPALLAVLAATALAAPTALAQSDQSNGGAPTLDAPSSGDPTPKRTETYRDTLSDAIADIQSYWTDEFPLLYGGEYERIPSDRIIAAHPGVKLLKCQGQTLTYDDAQDNAFYCYRSNFVAYDDVGLFPRLNRDFGPFAVALVLAHEWGHAIQDRADNAQQPTLVMEQQADCFAGAWTKRVADGDAEKIQLEGGTLDAALAAMIQFRDPVGTAADEEGAHGSGFDRTNAFQAGFDGGAEACAGFFENPPPVVEFAFASQDEASSGGNLPPRRVLPVTIKLLNDFYTQVEPAFRPKKLDDIYAFDSSSRDTLPDCGGTTMDAATVRNRVFFCAPDGNFGFEDRYLQHVYDDIGDFGVITLLADQFATYVETIQEFPGVNDNADNAVLGADCYTGGFARAMYDGDALLVNRKTGESKYQLSPGDLDETIQAFIDSSAALGFKDLDVTFDRLRAFRQGFFYGYTSCSSYASATASLG